jgi:hypothetical protein
MRNTEAGPEWTWRGPALPDRKPAYHRLLGAAPDRIWVWPARESMPVSAPQQWVLLGGPQQLWVELPTGTFDVFDVDGDFVGRVAVPHELGFAAFGTAPDPVIQADTVWWPSADSTGVQELARVHVRWPRPARTRTHARAARDRRKSPVIASERGASRNRNRSKRMDARVGARRSTWQHRYSHVTAGRWPYSTDER